ncbi:hypothetical protein [Sediminibacillus halophilus]|uniref:Uncharacterized protein n=1 Tax=Sediminibacillus halophilus TaxID=482461 RepID=A0A1G9WX00_9BACI|nr:hypothetical protein [Sediminibacillus halophilus]SDM88605.1 hypothetical protein SAMN05216244_3647 [Sediminibacillus halophilus]
MITYEIFDSNLGNVKPMDEQFILDEIEELIGQFGLTITQRTTLSTKKGCYHWHTKKERQKGVLEVTYWPKQGRLWLEIADNRKAEWNTKLIAEFADELTERYGGRVG